MRHQLGLGKRWLALTFAALALPSSGCFVATDLINPGLLAGLGFDPSTIIPPAGSIVVVLSNATDFPAEMNVAYSLTAAATAPEQSQGGGVNSGAQSSVVLECPVTLVIPGSIQEGENPATVFTGAGEGVAVAYTGSGVFSGDFRCGDVIELRLENVPGGQDGAQNFRIGVRVIPGS